MKIKVNLDKETVSLKGLTPMQFSLIEQLLSHVRLGDGTEASEAAFELLNAIEAAEDLDFIEKIEISIGATTDGHVEGLDLWMDSPTLVACEEDNDEDYGDLLDYYRTPTGAWPFDSKTEQKCGGSCDSCACDD